MGSATAGIAHDINNQLNLILNHLSILDPVALPDVAGALEAVRRCSALTGSLLSYARGESIQIGPLDPSVFLRCFISQLRVPKGIILAPEIPDVLPAIAADPLALTRALNNLISNALAAMRDRGVLSIRAARQTIEIGDSGPGIPPELQAAIFEPFFTTKGAHGTGLGLSIVREIMRQHSGSVTLRSKPGIGSRFTLRFRSA